jgi:hypothetical protein
VPHFGFLNTNSVDILHIVNHMNASTQSKQRIGIDNNESKLIVQLFSISINKQSHLITIFNYHQVSLIYEVVNPGFT